MQFKYFFVRVCFFQLMSMNVKWICHISQDVELDFGRGNNWIEIQRDSTQHKNLISSNSETKSNI